MNGQTLPPLPPALQAAIARSQEEEQGQRLLQKCLADLDQLQRLQRQAGQQAAQALALIHGQPVMVAALQVDETTGHLAGLVYRTADGVERTLTATREQAPVASGIIRP